MRKPFFVALTGLALVACGSDEGPQTPDPDEGGPCQIKSDKENTPAYPFNFQTFTAEIWPDLQASCALNTACHQNPADANTYNVWKAGQGECPDIESFNAFFAVANYQNPSASLLLKNMNGEDPHAPSFAGSALLGEVQAFIQTAADLANPPTDQTGLFDKQVFAEKVQPVLTQLNCASAGCHLAPNGVFGFSLFQAPANPSAELDANFAAVTSTKYIDQTQNDATATKFYLKSTDGHGVVTFAGTALTDLEAWIQGALDADIGNGGPILCQDKAKFNLAVFEDEILPMLEGRVDYNDIDGGRVSTGCTRGPCHGENRGPGSFYLNPNGSVQERLDSFRCFVDVQNPSNSQVLLCPLDLSACRKNHPGEDVFADVLDRNYQKLLAYIYATEAGNSPLDLAFFAQKINPIFSNPDDCAETGLACAESGCHERQPDGTADNGSNFPIIRDAADDIALFTNFIAAANFTFFPDATQSSLVLYPTNEIANVDDNDLATGQNHPGGVCFDINSQQSLDIQKFAGGLRPNGQGFLQDFLVAGLFPAANVTDNVAAFDEATVAPSVFERSGQSLQFNGGEWEGFFSANELVDIEEAFDGFNTVNQTVFLVAYVINSGSNDEEVVVTVDTENDVELFVGGSSTIGRDGDGAALTVTLPSYQDTKAITRVMLKAFRQADDATFAFTMNFTDENGVPFTDVGKELVFVLSSQTGGI